MLKNAGGFLRVAGTTFSGAMSGGFGSVMAGGNFWEGARNGAISAGLNHAMHPLQKFLNEYFTSKKEAYEYATQESLLIDMGDGIIIEREVSGWSLENGDYIVLDPIKNGYSRSNNNQLSARYKSGTLQVKYEGKWYNIKSHFHTHPSTMNYPKGRIGVSDADLNLMFNTLKGAPTSILYRGNEWILSPGNDYQQDMYNYSLKNIGGW